MSFFTYGELAAVHLTGRRRYRRGWFGKMILQVEVKHPKPCYPRAPQPPPAPYDPWRYGSFTFWRDANEFDVAKIDEGQAPVRAGVEPSKPWPRGDDEVAA